MVLDGSLFEKEQGGHTFALNRMERRRHDAPFLGSHAASHASTTADIDRGRAPGLSFPRCSRQGQSEAAQEKCHDGRVAAEKRACSVAAIVPLVVPRLGVGVGEALEAPRVGVLAIAVLFRAKN